MSTQSYEMTTRISADHYLALQVPDDIPVGPVRVAIIFETQSSHRSGEDIKNLLTGMPEVGEEADFSRPRMAHVQTI